MYFKIEMTDCGYVCIERFENKDDLLANLADVAAASDNDEWDLDILGSDDFERNGCLELGYEDDRETIVIIKGDVINGDVTKRTKVSLTG